MNKTEGLRFQRKCEKKGPSGHGSPQGTHFPTSPYKHKSPITNSSNVTRYLASQKIKDHQKEHSRIATHTSQAPEEEVKLTVVRMKSATCSQARWPTPSRPFARTETRGLSGLVRLCVTGW